MAPLSTLSLQVSSGLRPAYPSLATVAFCLLVASAAGAQSLDPLVRITGPSPLSGCSADRVKFQEQSFGSVLYKTNAIEPNAAIDPTDPDRILFGHQQDRWSDGGSRGLVGGLSDDGGKTWGLTIPSGVSACTGGPDLRSTDPWVAFAPDGTAFFSSLAFDEAAITVPQGSTTSAILVSRSRDHGATWGAPKTQIVDNSIYVFNDKNAITADPFAQGNVYTVWDRSEIFPGTNDSAGDLAAAAAMRDGVRFQRERAARLRAEAAGAPKAAAPQTRGPSYFSHSADNGASWSRAEPIFDPGVNSSTLNNTIVVAQNGDVLNFTSVFDPAGNVEIDLLRSRDKGFAWSRAKRVTDIQTIGTVTPDGHEAVRDGSTIFSVASDDKSGAIYLVWQDFRFNPGTQVSDVAFSQSLDGGATWSAPAMINKTPQNLSNPLRQQAFLPTVVVAGDGTIAVTYYDFRNDVGTPGIELADFFAAFCKPSSGDCSLGASWGHELKLTPNSFNMRDAPVAGGHFMGDYMGLVASGKHVWPVFGQTTGPNHVAEYTRKITLP